MKTKIQKDYTHLHQLSKHRQNLEGIQSLLSWDQETYMPKKGAEIRAEQLKTLAGVIHREKTGKPFVDALSKLIDLESGKVIQKGLTQAQTKALSLWRRDYLKASALPASFVEELAKLTSESIFTWEKAKSENHFKTFLPSLEKMISMVRKKADFLGYQTHPYDALLDLYEPEMTAKELEKIFTPLKHSILSLLKKIAGAKPLNPHFLQQNCTAAQQLAFGKKLLKWVGYPEEQGRLDLSSHPFSSSSHPTDSRITTRILPEMPISNIRTVLHECGHAFYEMGLPQEHYGSPLGESISLGIHESQSRWWETRIGMSRPFWTFCLPLLKKHFKKWEGISLENFWRAVNKVEPSLIRVEADEVTYALHVILRFELEIALIEGALRPAELPEAWSAKMKELLGIVPNTDREGCLQDIHWSMGAFGYFPTYALGNLYAAHLFETFEEEFPGWESSIKKGEFAFMRDWLERTVYRYGRQYNSKELLKRATGKAFSSKAFETYLNRKYQEVYRF